MMMRRLLTIIMSVLAGLVVLGLGISWMQENHIARGVTIVVQTPDRAPIGNTIILLEAAYEKSSVQSQTNERGELFFRKLTAGTYIIRATQVYCDNGARGAQTMVITIGQELNNRISYFPCG